MNCWVKAFAQPMFLVQNVKYRNSFLQNGCSDLHCHSRMNIFITSYLHQQYYLFCTLVSKWGWGKELHCFNFYLFDSLTYALKCSIVLGEITQTIQEFKNLFFKQFVGSVGEVERIHLLDWMLCVVVRVLLRVETGSFSTQ